MISNKKPLVSIIIPVYNNSFYLEKCVESARNQTYENIEIILIDDGSNDGSEKICDEYSKNYSNIFVIHKENEGCSTARNKGIMRAKGEFLLFLDSDDSINSSIVEIFVEAAVDTEADMVAAGLEQKNEEGNVVGRLCPKEKIICSGVEALRLHYQEKSCGMALVYVTGRLYNKKVFQNLKFNPSIFYEDVEIMPYVMARVGKMIYLPIIGYYYNIHQDSISHNSKNMEKLYADSFEIWKNHLQFYREKQMKEFERYICFLICEKVLCHDKKNNIPNRFYLKSKIAFEECFVEAMKSRVSIKRRIRLLLYRFFRSNRRGKYV